MSERMKLAAKTTEAKKENSVSQKRKTEQSQPMRSPADKILFLQRTIGNQAVQGLIRSGELQAKLKISTPGDRYEQEADRTAERVIASKPMQAPHEGKAQVQRISDAPAAPVADNFIQNLGPGQPLDPATRAYFEPCFGHDFSDVQIHTAAKAAEAAMAVDARAFTVGRDVVFGAGEYVAGKASSQQLLVHELTHVMQQEGFGACIQCASKAGGASDVNEALARNAASATVNMYQFTVEGRTLTLTETEFNREKARVNKRLDLAFILLEEEAIYDKQQHQEFLDKVHGWAGIISDIKGDTVPPHVGIWSWPVPAIKSGRRALESGNFELAGRQLKLAQESFHDAQREWNVYIEKTSEGAQKAITTLQYTRDISFAIAIGTAAVVAAPVVAGALVGTGAMTAGTTLATGAIVTAGGAGTGAVLRGGSSAAGQALAGSRVSGAEVWNETKEGAKRGAVDAASAVVGFGAGKALGLGAKGLSLGGKVVRGGVAGGASGATGGALESSLERKSAGEILKDTGKGALAGTVGGVIGSAASHISTGSSKITRYVAETLGEAGGGAASAAVTGGSLEDIEKAAISSVIAGRATAAASHPTTNVPKETQSKQAPPLKPPSMKVTGPSQPSSVPEQVKTDVPVKTPEALAAPEPAATKSTEPVKTLESVILQIPTEKSGAVLPQPNVPSSPLNISKVPQLKSYFGGGPKKEGGRKGMRNAPMPEVEKVPQLRIPKRMTALSNTERAMVSDAKLAMARLGKPLAVKTKSATAEGEVIKSGFGEQGGGKKRTQLVMDKGKEIGHDFAKNSSLDEGVPGQEKAGHAEKLAAMDSPGKALAVDRVMCPDCFAFFKKLAQSRGTNLVVHEPGNTWVFRPDGVRIGLSQGAQVVLHPDGSAAASPMP